MTPIPLSKAVLPGVPLVESPLFAASLDAMGLDVEERRIAQQLHAFGFAVIEFPDPAFEARAERIKSALAPQFAADFADPEADKCLGDMRIQDAWRFDEDVQAIAANPRVLALLSKLYGRRAFPFQTLNFPVGTQQAAHSDSNHFSSLPERFMCGVWVALEDVLPDAGPLLYHPGSHKWPIVTNAMVGRSGWGSQVPSAQSPFEAAWQAMAAAQDSQPELFTPRKGEALIWAANLLHGGSRQTNPRRTRWSQVTHYYFGDCVYYSPAFSDEPLGRLDLREIVNVATGEIEPNLHQGEEVTRASVPPKARARPERRWWQRRPETLGADPVSALPDEFDPDTYLRLNPDIGAAGEDPFQHWIKHGAIEGRRYR